MNYYAEETRVMSFDGMLHLTIVQASTDQQAQALADALNDALRWRAMRSAMLDGARIEIAYEKACQR